MSTKRRKERFTVLLPPELIEWARDAVAATPGLTLSGLTEDAIRSTLLHLEAKRGQRFPARKPGQHHRSP